MLTAGLGTRLRPLTDVRAKPAIPVAGEPLIRRIARWLASQGITDLVLNLHHRPETIAAVLGDGCDLGVRVRYSWEQPHLLGSAGGPRLALPLIGEDPFAIVNGDTLTDLDVAELAAAHDASGALVTLALVPNRNFHRYGGVHLDAAGCVVRFSRPGLSAEGSYHYIGVQMTHAAAFRDLAANEPANSVGGVYDALMAGRPGTVRGYVCDADFVDIGTVADYWRTSERLLAPGGPRVARGARIDPSARVTGSIVWDDVTVGRNATIDTCIVTDRVVVPDDAAYHRVILRHDARTGDVVATPLVVD